MRTDSTEESNAHDRLIQHCHYFGGRWYCGVVRLNFQPMRHDRSMQVQKILTAITGEQAKSLLPPRYTGFVAATHAAYATIEKAGVAVGKIKART